MEYITLNVKREIFYAKNLQRIGKKKKKYFQEHKNSFLWSLILIVIKV